MRKTVSPTAPAGTVDACCFSRSTKFKCTVGTDSGTKTACIITAAIAPPGMLQLER